MQEIKIGLSNKVLLYDSIRILPEERYHEFNKYALMDLGIGSDMNAITAHHQKLDQALAHKNIDDAVQARKNMHLSYFYQIEKINFTSLCFGTLVYQINKDFCYDFSLDGVQATISKLSKMGMKHSHVVVVVEDIKKNLRQSLGFVSLEGM